MHDRRVVGKHRGGALEEAQRRQRLEVRFIAVEVGFVNAGHGKSRPSAITNARCAPIIGISHLAT
jgi:hypothetical protein